VGDALLKRTASAIRNQLRAEDVIVRLGDDEFLCIMPGANLDSVRSRFRDIRKALIADREPCEMKAAFAMFEPDDTAAALVDRADKKARARRPIRL